MPLDNDDIKQLIAILQRGLTQNDSDTEEEEDRPVKKTRAKKTPSRGAKKKAAKPKRVNMFDQMAESRMHKEDVVIDKKIRRGTPTLRRDTFKPLRVSCRVCGRTEEIDPSIIEGIDRYKCNKCAISPG